MFEAYPGLKNYIIISMNIGKDYKAAIFTPLKVILLDSSKLTTKEKVESSLIHEIQHAIQSTEGTPGARTKINGGYAYYTSLREIESKDASNRLKMLEAERKINVPETAKENPIHSQFNNYLNNRTEVQREIDEKYIKDKEAKEKIKESIKDFLEWRIGHEEDVSESISEDFIQTYARAKRNTSIQDNESKRISEINTLEADKQSAFSMPQNTKYSIDTIEKGEIPVRDVDVQARTGDKYVSRYARTLAEAGVTTDAAVDLIQKDVEKGNLSYEPVTDQKANNYAEKYIKDNGFKDSLTHWNELIKRNQAMTKEELALGQQIYNQAVQNKDVPLGLYAKLNYISDGGLFNEILSKNLHKSTF